VGAAAWGSMAGAAAESTGRTASTARELAVGAAAMGPMAGAAAADDLLKLRSAAICTLLQGSGSQSHALAELRLSCSR